jgi:hypothetical protein
MGSIPLYPQRAALYPSNEFATNAAKYGALSQPSGHIEIAISEADKRGIAGVEGTRWSPR